MSQMSRNQQATTGSQPDLESTERCVAIVMTMSGGHRGYYLQLLIEEAIADGVRPIVVVPADTGEDLIREALPDTPNVTVVRMEHVSMREAERAVNELACAKGWRLGTMTYPDGDALLVSALLGKRRSVQRLLIMRPRPERGARAHLRWGGKVVCIGLIRLLRKRLTVLQLQDAMDPRPALPTWLAKPVVDPIRVWLPAGVTKAGERRRWGWSEDELVVIIAGTLDGRKNIPLGFDIVGMLSTEGRRPRLVLAGKIADEIRPYILRRISEVSAGVTLLDRRLLNPELDSLLFAADVAICWHENAGASGIAGRATALGTGVVRGYGTADETRALADVVRAAATRRARGPESFEGDWHPFARQMLSVGPEA